MHGRPQKRGPVAQLGARLNGIEEVRGSNPLRSTIFCALNRSSRLAKSITESRVAVEARYGWQSTVVREGVEPRAPAAAVQGQPNSPGSSRGEREVTAAGRQPLSCR